MKQNKFLILLFYYNRPKIFLNALNSILDIKYDNFEVHVIDDGSEIRAEPIVKKICEPIINKFRFTYIDDTVEVKKNRGGSNFGKFANESILDSDADHIIPLCDDDAIYPDFLDNLNVLLNEKKNYDKNYFYHHVIIYDSLVETYKEGLEKHNKSYFTNGTTYPINCCRNVDSSQVTFSNNAFKQFENVRYPFPKTANLDADIFQAMYENWGLAHFSGLISQIKSVNKDNLAERWYEGKMYLTKDLNEI